MDAHGTHATPEPQVKRLLKSYSAWEIVLCVIGVVVCLIPTVPRTGAFWGHLRIWTGINPGKIQIHTVVPGSPADVAGLQSGDWVVAVNDQQFVDFKPFDDALARLQPGSEVKLHVERGGQEFDVRAVGQSPEVEAVYFYEAQVASLLICAMLAIFLAVTQPLRPTPLWRPLPVVVIGFAGACLLTLGFVSPGAFGWSAMTWFRVRQWWLIDNDPNVPRLIVQSVCLGVAVGLLVAATFEAREVLRRWVAARDAMAHLRRIADGSGQDGARDMEAEQVPGGPDGTAIRSMNSPPDRK
jgi:PDZ domain